MRLKHCYVAVPQILAIVVTIFLLGGAARHRPAPPNPIEIHALSLFIELPYRIIFIDF
jgi:hypothetical protein